MQQDGHYREIAIAQLMRDDAQSEEESPSHQDRMKDPKRVTAAMLGVNREERRDEEI
jgi:hypothetical protein